MTTGIWDDPEMYRHLLTHERESVARISMI